LAKTVTTLDVLSGGRMWLGVGAGHYREECDGLGVPFPPTPARFELLEDALEVCLRIALLDPEIALGADAAAVRRSPGISRSSTTTVQHQEPSSHRAPPRKGCRR
jgi:Luciferase-like monooxygenase